MQKVDVASTALDNFLVIVLDKILANEANVANEADHIICAQKPLDSFKPWSGRRMLYSKVECGESPECGNESCEVIKSVNVFWSGSRTSKKEILSFIFIAKYY